MQTHCVHSITWAHLCIAPGTWGMWGNDAKMKHKLLARLEEKPPDCAGELTWQAWLISLESPACKVAFGAWIGIWIWGGFSPSPELIRMVQGLNCLYKWCDSCWMPALLWRVWNFGPGHTEAACMISPSEDPGGQALKSFPNQQHCPCVCHSSLLEELRVSCVTSGRGLSAPGAWFPCCFAPAACALSLCRFCFVSSHRDGSELWAQLYVGTCESSYRITGPRLGDPDIASDLSLVSSLSIHEVVTR